jgi:hypothetical protein
MIFFGPGWPFKGADSRKNTRKIYRPYNGALFIMHIYAIKVHFLGGRGIYMPSEWERLKHSILAH